MFFLGGVCLFLFVGWFIGFVFCFVSLGGFWGFFGLFVVVVVFCGGYEGDEKQTHKMFKGYLVSMC